MNIRIRFLFILIVCSLSGYSQDVPGSVYSNFGFGNVLERSSAYTRAVGTSIAVRSDNNLNAANPAALTSIASPVTSFFEIGTNYGTTHATSSTASSFTKAGGLTGINYWFRFSKKWGSLVGVSPYTSSTYTALYNKVIGATGSTIPAHADGSGGVNQFYFGNGFDVLKNLTLGVTLSYYLGSVKKRELYPVSVIASALEVENQITGSGGSIDFGMQYVLSVKKTKFIFGATYDPGTSLTGNQQIAIVNPINFDTLRKNDKKPLHSRIPPSYGGGIGFRHDRSSFSAEVKFTEWTKAHFDQPATYQNILRYAAGYEYRGDFNSVNYLNTISARAGVWYADYPVVVRGTYLNTWGYTLGLSFPVQGNRASVSLNYSVTSLGTTKNELVNESSRKLSLDIIVRDVWGIKRKFD